MKTYACGHINPDTDSVCSAIALAYLKTQIGEPCIPACQGGLSPESEFVLSTFGLEKPELKNDFSGENLYITDYSDLAQAPHNLKETNILGIVDHHKLGDITTSTPLECWIRPVGCTCTIVKEMFEHHKVEIPKNIAGAMMLAILSDTVLFKSPTCTKADTKAVKELAQIAGVEDFKALGMEMFLVKSAVKGATPRTLLLRDYKDFEMGGNKIGIGQLEVVDLKVFDDMKEALFADMKAYKAEGGRHTVMLLLTDIITEGSQFLVVSDDESKVESAFGKKLENHQMWVDGVLSRKKQVIPVMEKQF
ncbi:MAG: manganese-dependent inorganic pyrophosphatase [Sulfurospirillaceae bacterium]|nr:manganese-dependent inorganic pyrophosphatase [Sulfurospirillaceae bacterium]MDD3463165.1 manganese-dependent inorganic pyrophosphatase [Sulfurospirillaceae bacterium]